MTTSTDESLSRALAFLRQSMGLVGAEITPIPEGFAVRTRSLPLVWSFNHVEVTSPVDVDDAKALADRHRRI